MKHIIFFSGGIGSYFTAKRVIEKYGSKDVWLLFTDTNYENDDLYRFNMDAIRKLRCNYIHLNYGKDVWECAFDENFLYNSRVANCTKKLKMVLSKKYIKEYFPNAEDVTLYLGIDWTEVHRTHAIIKNWKPYNVEFPMTEEPFLQKPEMLEYLKEDGIETPLLYKQGFSHNNCNGFCFKAGKGHFKNLLDKNREFYLYNENKEQELIKKLGKDVSILKDTTLRDLRIKIESAPDQMSFDDLCDIGGCGCFLEEE
ncbi:MAG: hypothetical protein R3Y05_01165 [bacterium]